MEMPIKASRQERGNRLVDLLGKNYIWVILGVALIVLPLIYKDIYSFQLINMICIYALVAGGLNLIMGICGQFSVGQAAIFGIGAYASALLTVQLGLPFWLALPLAGFLTMIAGTIIFGPILKLKGNFLAMATIAFGVIVYQVMMNFIWLTKGPSGITAIPAPQIGSFSLKPPYYFFYIVLGVLCIQVIGLNRLMDSRVGRAMKAIRDNEQAAEVIGINPFYYKTIAFAVGSFCAGIAGSLYAHMISYVSPHPFTFDLSVLFVAMVVVGGVGSSYGPLMGATLLYTAGELLRPFGEYRMIIYALIVYVILVFCPQGLNGLFQKIKLLKEK